MVYTTIFKTDIPQGQIRTCTRVLEDILRAGS